MRSLGKTRRMQVIAAAALFLVSAVALIGYGMRDGINFFRSPSQVVEERPEPAEVFRLGGLVEEGSLITGEGGTIRFAVTDGAVSIPVTYSGIRPDLFEEGQGTIATGRYLNGVFEATGLLARHDETYMPKEVVDALKEQGVYRGSD